MFQVIVASPQMKQKFAHSHAHMDNRDNLECGHSQNRVTEDIQLFLKGSEYVILKDKELAVHRFREGPL